MKTLIICLSTALLFSTTQGITKEERTAAVKELNATKNHLNSALLGLSEGQLNFKSGPNTWSIAECVEHMVISEENIFGMLQGALQTPADPSKRDEVVMTDKNLMALIIDRSNKVKTSKPFEPTGQYGTHRETYEAFKEKRAHTIQFVKTTTEDLRNHYTQLPFGTIDGYQVLIFMSGHTERHIRQIEEVKNHPDFPKE
ncbi:MAG: DinB family protein [Bacteroidota bacterium]